MRTEPNKTHSGTDPRYSGWRRAVWRPLSAAAAGPADELDDDAHQPSGYHDDLVWCGTGKQLNDAGML